MEVNFGEKLVERQKSKARIIRAKVISGAICLLCLGLGLCILFEWVDLLGYEADFIWRLLIACVKFIFAALAAWFFLATGPESAALYEEGLVITDGKKEHKIHFNDIVGLEDTDERSTYTTLSGGIVGAVISTAVTAAASSISAGNRVAARKRGIRVVLKDGARHEPLDTVGQDLAETFTEWLLKDIADKDIMTLDMRFGDALVLKDGYLVCTEIFTNGGNDAKVHISKLTRLSYEDSTTMHFIGINDKGKEKALMKAKSVYNIDALVHIIGLAANKEDQLTPLT